MRVFVNVYIFVCVSFPFDFEGGVWDSISSYAFPFSFTFTTGHIYVCLMQ